MARKILHLDLDAFFCCVEEQLDPSLRGKAFAVGGQPDDRGVVAACSYEARRYGIHSAMPMATAVRLCPHLLIVPNRRGEYSRVSRRVMAILHDTTPIVEQLSIDEAFVDVSGLPGGPLDIARTVQGRINNECGLPCSLGVATSKLVAKIANDVGKRQASEQHQDGPARPPNAITVVPTGEEAAFLAPLPVTALWGVGPRTAEHLEQLGVVKIGQLAEWPADDLTRRFGKHGNDLSRRACGIDERPVEVERETKSISSEITYSRDVSDGDALRRTLRELCESVGRRLRREGLTGTTVQIKLRWADFTTITRQTTLLHATDQDDEIYQTAEALFAENWPLGRRVRLIGVGVSGFVHGGRQLGLWDAPVDHASERLAGALDSLRERFGDSAVKRGSSLRASSHESSPEDEF